MSILQHLLLDGYCSRQVRDKMREVGFNIHLDMKSMMHALFQETLPDSENRLFWLIMCTTNSHIWKTRAKTVLEQNMTSSGPRTLDQLSGLLRACF